MIERVLENWLDSATERTYEVPFSYILQAQGHTIIHISRHCGMEMGKDIITIGPDGLPCAFQLKSPPAGRRHMTLTEWRKINGQIVDLLTTPIVHPSIPKSDIHRSYLVTNGEFNEEVSRAIDDLNRGWIDKGHPEIRLDTWVRGQIIDQARNLGMSLWPSELEQVRTLLEMFLIDGRDRLPREKMHLLLQKTLHLDPKDRSAVEKYLCERQLTAAALLCAIATHSFAQNKNYVAEVEAWTMYLSYFFASVERRSLQKSKAKIAVDLSIEVIYNRLFLLCEELKERGHYVEGDAIADKPVYQVRMTLLIGLMSVYYLWSEDRQDFDESHRHFLDKFLIEKRGHLIFWGEAAVPHLFSYYLWWRLHDATVAPDAFIFSMIEHISQRNAPISKDVLPSPYYSEEQVLPHFWNVPGYRLDDQLSGHSHTIEALLHIITRHLWKQQIKGIWSEIAPLAFDTFFPNKPWQFYLWRCSEGVDESKMQPTPKNWSDLNMEANAEPGENLPKLLASYPFISLLLLFIIPQRFRPDIVHMIERSILK